MATIKDLAIEYANYLLINQENPHVVSEIANRIHGLTYTTTGNPLSETDINTMIDSILEEIRTPKTAGGQMLKEAEDNTSLLAMVDKIRAAAKRSRSK